MLSRSSREFYYLKRVAFLGTCLLGYSLAVIAATGNWDRNGAIRAFQSAGRMNAALHQSPSGQRSPQVYLAVISRYREVLLKDPHYSGCDDSLLSIATLYRELAENAQETQYARLAAANYIRLAEQYPLSPHRTDSLLAAGQVNLDLIKNYTEASRLFRRVISLSPGTSQSKVAMDKLAELGKRGDPADSRGNSGSPLKEGPKSSLPQPQPAQVNSTGSRDLTRVLGLKAAKIVLDPGHGGHDYGTQSRSGFKEKDLTLDLALRLKNLINQELGIEVVLTRESDVFVPLEERTRIANQHKADMFVSIHANFSSQAKTSGVETYVLDFARSNSEHELAARENADSHRTIAELEDLVRIIARREKLQESRELARWIQVRLQAEMKRQNPASKNRGIKQAPFVVLAGASMPSILTEVAFLSNKRDADSLQQPKNRQSAAIAMLAGVRQYINSLGMATGLPLKGAKADQ
jgi:N-acetylmuramoyl-L-alanine amidase